MFILYELSHGSDDNDINCKLKSLAMQTFSYVLLKYARVQVHANIFYLATMLETYSILYQARVFGTILTT